VGFTPQGYNNHKQLNLFENVSKLPQNADVVIGGFPCQDFSLAGKRKGLSVERGKLYQSMAKVIHLVQPKVFLAENVKGLISWGNGLALKTIIDDFTKLGYNVEYKLFNTADYGVPQNRERIIIIGIRKDLDKKFDWSKPTHSANDKNLLPWVTIQEAIQDLEDDESISLYQIMGILKQNISQGNREIKKQKPTNQLLP
jgi:DNA (cytosine-5)-methyltransferase 1